MRMRIVSNSIPALAALFCLTCRPVQTVKHIFQNPDTEPLREILLSALPLGYAASIAMSAVRGESIPGVSVSQSCAGFPCNALVNIDVDSTGVVPPGVASTRTVVVAGLWSNDSLAFLSMFFADLDTGAAAFTLANVSTVPVTIENGAVRVVYAREDVNAGSDTVLTVSLTQDEIDAEMTRLETRPPADSSVTVDQEAWIVDADNGGTPGLLADDTYTVSGGGQFVEVGAEEAYILQITFLFVKTAAACLRNPFDGTVVSRNTGVTSSGQIGTKPLIGTVIFGFHQACDGRVDVPLATGVYATATRHAFDLHISSL